MNTDKPKKCEAGSLRDCGEKMAAFDTLCDEARVKELESSLAVAHLNLESRTLSLEAARREIDRLTAIVEKLDDLSGDASMRAQNAALEMTVCAMAEAANKDRAEDVRLVEAAHDRAEKAEAENARLIAEGADCCAVRARLTGRVKVLTEAAQNYLDGNNCHPDNECSSDCEELARTELIAALTDGDPVTKPEEII